MTTMQLDRIVKNKQDSCAHEWKNYKQTIQVDNPAFPHHWQPYFIIRGCHKCHEKRVLKYILH